MSLSPKASHELEESTEATVREARYRAEYEQAEQQLAAELSMQAAQNLQYLEAEQRIYAQARVQTVEAGLAMEYAQAQSNLHNAYLRQVQEVNEQLTTAEAQFQSSIRNFHDQTAAQTLQSDQLRRELANAQREAEANKGKIALVEETLAQERGLSSHNLQLQAEKWEEHTSTITIQAEEAIADLQEQKGEALEEIDHLSQRLIHTTSELEEWDRWYATPGENDGVGEEELLQEQPAPTTPTVCSIPSRFLPPTTVPSFATKAPTTTSAPATHDDSRYPPEKSSLPTFAPMTPQQVLPQSPPGISAPTTPVPFSSTQVPSSSASLAKKGTGTADSQVPPIIFCKFASGGLTWGSRFRLIFLCLFSGVGFGVRNRVTDFEPILQ